MTTTERTHQLLLIWTHPVSGEQFVFGRLWRDGDTYRFRYERAARESVDQALAEGFRLLQLRFLDSGDYFCAGFFRGPHR